MTWMGRSSVWTGKYREEREGRGRGEGGEGGEGKGGENGTNSSARDVGLENKRRKNNSSYVKY